MQSEKLNAPREFWILNSAGGLALDSQAGRNIVALLLFCADTV
jgi:hypothetical protein